MNASIRSNLPPHNSHPTKRGMTGLFTKKLTTSQHDDAEKTTPQVDSSIPKKDGNNIGAVMRNEKIENARFIANAVIQQRQKLTAPQTPTMQNALQERLEAKLLATEVECTKLRKLAEVGKRGIPLSLGSLHLGFELEKESCLGENHLLQKLEELIFEKEEECVMVRKRLVEARKRVAPERAVTRSMSVPAHLSSPAPTSILQRQPSSGNLLKSVSWGDGKENQLTPVWGVGKENKRTPSVRKLLVEARKRVTPWKERGVARAVSLRTCTDAPKSILRRQPSCGNLKTVSWGAM
jgi:hypothetical protein